MDKKRTNENKANVVIQLSTTASMIQSQSQIKPSHCVQASQSSLCLPSKSSKNDSNHDNYDNYINHNIAQDYVTEAMDIDIAAIANGVFDADHSQEGKNPKFHQTQHSYGEENSSVVTMNTDSMIIVKDQPQLQSQILKTESGPSLTDSDNNDNDNDNGDDDASIAAEHVTCTNTGENKMVEGADVDYSQYAAQIAMNISARDVDNIENKMENSK